MSDVVSLPAAVHVLTARQAPLVILTLSLLALVSQAVPDSLQTVTSIIFTAWIAGYSLSVSRKVLLGSDDPIGGLFALKEHGRHALGYWLLVLIPLFAVGMPLSVLGTLTSLFASPQVAGIAARVLFVVMLLLSAACVLLAPVVQVSRYIFFDRLGEGLHFLDAAKRAWHHRQDAAAPVLFTLVAGSATLLARYALGLALDSRFLDVGEAVHSLTTSSMSARPVGVVVLGALLAVVANAVLLVEAHLVGQYTAVAYSPAESMTCERSA